MFVATMTSKGQTTIPGEIRASLNLKTFDKLIFIPDGDRVYIKTLPVNINGLLGSFKKKGSAPIDFGKLRATVKKKIVSAVMKE